MQTRDDIVKQMISMRIKFQNYKSFATATMDDVIPPDMRQGALRLKANTLESVYLHNEGNSKFTMTPLPTQGPGYRSFQAWWSTTLTATAI